MFSYLSVAFGGALGTLARFWVSGMVASRFGETLPLGTLFVNVTGSFVAGLFVAVAGAESRVFISPNVRQFFLIGVCGGYTTFSSFSVQTLALMQEGEWLYALANALGSFVLCLLMVWAGYALGALVVQR